MPHHSPTELILRLAELRDDDVLFIDEGQLPEPFVDRFENREQLRYYDVRELTEMIRKVAQCATIPIDLAHREPRVAGTKTIDLATVARTLTRLQILDRGLGGGPRARSGVIPRGTPR